MWVQVHSAPVCFDRGRGVLHLHELVPHQRPCSQVAPVQAERPTKALHRLFVLALERVVVSDDAAGIGGVLVSQHRAVSQLAQGRKLLLDKEDVGEDVHAVEAEWVLPEDVLKQALRFVIVLQVVVHLPSGGTEGKQKQATKL
eukprot:366286-Chlamydomonas_euryale.AAC.10